MLWWHWHDDRVFRFGTYVPEDTAVRAQTCTVLTKSCAIELALQDRCSGNDGGGFERELNVWHGCKKKHWSQAFKVIWRTVGWHRHMYFRIDISTCRYNHKNTAVRAQTIYSADDASRNWACIVASVLGNVGGGFEWDLNEWNGLHKQTHEVRLSKSFKFGFLGCHYCVNFRLVTCFGAYMTILSVAIHVRSAWKLIKSNPYILKNA